MINSSITVAMCFFCSPIEAYIRDEMDEIKMLALTRKALAASLLLSSFAVPATGAEDLSSQMARLAADLRLHFPACKLHNAERMVDTKSLPAEAFLATIRGAVVLEYEAEEPEQMEQSAASDG